MDKILKFLGLHRTIIDKDTDYMCSTITAKDYGLDEKYGIKKDSDYIHFLVFTPDENDKDYDNEMVIFDKLALRFLFFKLRKLHNTILMNNIFLILLISSLLVLSFISVSIFMILIFAGISAVSFVFGLFLRKRLKEKLESFHFLKNFKLVFNE